MIVVADIIIVVVNCSSNESNSDCADDCKEGKKKKVECEETLNNGRGKR